jgi:hypothetical protein
MTSKDYLEQKLKERYEFEFEQKDRIEAKIALPVTIVTFLSGSIIYYAQNPINYVCSFWYIVFMLISLVFIGSMLSTVYFTMRTLIPYYYKHITEPDKLQKHYDELIEYHRDKNNDTDVHVLNKLKESIKNEYLESAQYNSNTNEKKSEYLYHARQSMFVSIYALVVCSIIYFSLTTK